MAAFTLVEMVIVIGIILVLASMIVPAIVPLVRSYQIGVGGRQVESQLELARQLALTRNRTVEVRFCQPTGGQFTAMLTGVVDTSSTGTSTYTLTDKPVFLPSSVIMDAGKASSSSSTLSSLLDPDLRTAKTAGSTDPYLGSFKTGYNYVPFQFKSDGSTNLDVNSRWFVTVHISTDGDNLSKTPNNYFTLQVDAYNGRIREFRP